MAFFSVLKYSPDQLRDKGRFARMAGAGENIGTSDIPRAVSQRASQAQAKTKVQQIKTRMVAVNNQLLDHVADDTTDSPDAKKNLEELKALSRELYRQDADPGGFEGIGLPGGARDVVIVGAGPGGLSAAINGGTEGLDTLVIDANPKAGGQAKHSSRIENLPGHPAGISGKTLSRKLVEQAERVGAQSLFGVRVEKLTVDAAGLKTLHLSNGTTVQSRTVILANGMEFKRLEFQGSLSAKVSVGDGDQMERDCGGGEVVVIGGSNGAAQAALGAAKKASKVTIIARSAIERGMSKSQVEAVRNNKSITIIEDDEIQSFDEQAKTVTLRSGKTVPAKAVGLFVGQFPTTDWLPTELKRTAQKRIEVNEDLETTIPGVFAVGDVRAAGTAKRTLGRVGAAMGEGQVAIANVFQYFERLGSQTKVQPLVQKGDREVARKANARTVKNAQRPRWNFLIGDGIDLDIAYPYLEQEDDAY